MARDDKTYMGCSRCQRSFHHSAAHSCCVRPGIRDCHSPALNAPRRMSMFLKSRSRLSLSGAGIPIDAYLAVPWLR